MSFTTNLSESPMEPGTYLATVIRTNEIVTKSGYPMVWVDWQTEDGQLATQGIAFVPQMVGRNNHLLKAMGQPYGEALTIDPAAWEGVRCLITVGLRDGKAEVTDLAPADGGQSTLSPIPAGEEVPF